VEPKNCRIGQHTRCFVNGCEFSKFGGGTCSGYKSRPRVKSFDSVLKEAEKQSISQPTEIIATLKDVDGKKYSVGKQQFHYWVGVKSGYVMASNKDFKPPKRNGERMKYMGYTYDIGWPKKMNTGRILHKPKAKKKLSQGSKN